MSKGKLINNISSCVQDSLRGFVIANPSLKLIANANIVIRADFQSQVKKCGKVAIVCGGGSGHEPAHIGFIGQGCLSAVVCGEIFTSPSSSAILEAILQVGYQNKSGVLLIIKNYTGDRINFALAENRARAMGIKVMSILVADDCAIENPLPSIGRRGVAGTIFIHKIAGAMADAGYDLETICHELQQVQECLASVAMCVTRCSLPGQSTTTIRNDDDFFEMGVGIHGEAGYFKQSINISAHDLVGKMIDKLTIFTKTTNETVKEIALMINNLGATSQLELYLVVNECVTILRETHGFIVKRLLVGHFMTALDMGGFSISLLMLKDSNWLTFIDAPTNAPAWPKSLTVPLLDTQQISIPAVFDQLKQSFVDNSILTATTTTSTSSFSIDSFVLSSIKCACEALIAREQELNALDGVSGDADCGTTHAAGAKAVLDYFSSSSSSTKQQNVNFQTIFENISQVLENHMGGTSGGLWSLFFSAVAVYFVDNNKANGGELFNQQILCNGFLAGVDRMQQIGRAKVGDRTCLDALVPTLLHWKNLIEENNCVIVNRVEILNILNNVCRQAANQTKAMLPRAGRSGYLNPNDILKANIVDPGAEAVAIVLQAVYTNALAMA